MAKDDNKYVKPQKDRPGSSAVAKGSIAVKGNEASFGFNGYPNAIPSTQTVKTRGTGAATKGTNSSTKLG